MSDKRSSLWGKNRGIYFGYETKTTEGDDRTPRGREVRYVGDRHVMSIGPNGSGKSRRLLSKNLFFLTSWSIVVVDPKGELAKMTRAYREAQGAETIILNPFDVLDMGSDGFNPVAALDPDSDDFPDDALVLAEALIRIEGKEPHWSASAQDLMTALIMYSRIEGRNGGSLGHVRSLLGRNLHDFKITVSRMSAMSGAKAAEAIKVKAARFSEINAESRELTSILSTALTQTRWLDSILIQKDLASLVPHDFGQLKTKPTTVYLILPARRLGSHSTWVRLMIAAILQPLMKDTVKAEVPVMLALDEYPALTDGEGGGFPLIDRLMPMFRGYGVKLWTVWQDLNQAQRIYGRGWESFAANSGVLQSFAPQDVTTADYLSKRMPLMTMRSESVSHTLAGTSEKQSSPQHAMSISEQGMPLMLPQHLRNMDEGFSIMFTHQAKGPIRSFMPYLLKGMEQIDALDPAN